jgi:hypothetical protein
VNDHDLHEQLERLGRRPVPPPRPEFVESLLARIQLTDDLCEPAPVVYLRRQNWARARVAFAGAAAAVLLGAVGMLALARGGPDGGQTVTVRPAAAEEGPEFQASIEDGELVDGPAEDVKDGDYWATCTQGGELKYGDDQSLVCATGETVRVTVKDNRIVDVTRGGPTVRGSEPSDEGPTTVTQQSLGLDATELPGGGVELSWSAATGEDVARYVVVRRVPEASEAKPVIDDPGHGEVVPLDSADALTTVETFEGLEGSPRVAYSVFALDDAGEVLSRSKTMIVSLDWAPSSTTR